MAASPDSGSSVPKWRGGAPPPSPELALTFSAAQSDPMLYRRFAMCSRHSILVPFRCSRQQREAKARVSMTADTWPALCRPWRLQHNRKHQQFRNDHRLLDWVRNVCVCVAIDAVRVAAIRNCGQSPWHRKRTARPGALGLRRAHVAKSMMVAFAAISIWLSKASDDQ
eukprot:2186093-Amphidinium_carterae.1